MSNLVGQSLGRYHILEQLGEGGMAIVYKAFDTRLERNVAIKVVLPGKEHSEKFLKRFEREAKALAQLSHPNIVKVIDYGEHEGMPYLVMEYLPGGTLKTKLSGKPLPWQDAVKFLIPIARALSYAHAHKIIHRDVKPSNILITDSGEPMLSDFGIAKMLEAEETLDLTGAGIGIGTPEYMSPEQAQGKPVDARSDVYSLGVVFYEMVTGRRPYQADTPMAVIFKLASEPLPRPRQFISDLPIQVELVLLKALARDSENRFSDCDKFLHTINDLTTGLEKNRLNQQPNMFSMNKRGANLKQPSRFVTIILLSIVGIILSLFFVGLGRKEQWFPDILATRTPSNTLTPTLTITPTVTLTRTSTLTQTPRPVITNTATLVPEFMMPFTVSGQSRWQDARISLLPGDSIIIQYVSGQWGWTGNVQQDADGDYQTCEIVCGPIAYSCPLQQGHEGSLVARIGDVVFEVGRKKAYDIPEDLASDRSLELRMNDCDLGLHDNQGSIEVTIQIYR